MKQWNYTKMGLQQGPVPEDELRQKIRRGEIGDATLVWREGMTDWLPLSQVAELQASPPPSSQKPEPHNNSPFDPPAQQPVPASQAMGNIPLAQPPAYHGNYVAPKIPTYMWQSVLATVLGLPFCCLLAMPFGIVAIVFASKVEGMRVQGDFHGATTASNNAKTWMIASFVCSAIGFALQIFNILSKNM